MRKIIFIFILFLTMCGTIALIIIGSYFSVNLFLIIIIFKSESDNL